MPYYHYNSNSPKGRKKTSVIEAASLSEAKEKLRTQRILIFSIKEVSVLKNKWIFGRNREHLKKEHLSAFTTQLAQLLSAKIPLYESLLSLAEQYKHDNFLPIISSLCEQIKTGCTLSESMAKFPKSFTQLYRSMIAAGESIGALDSALEKLSHMLAKEIKLKKQISTALIYPCLLCGFSLVLLTILFAFVVPSLQTVFEDQHVNRFTQIVFDCSYVITHGWPYYLPIFLGLLVGCVWFLKRPSGKIFQEKCYLHLPILRTLAVQSSIARFSRTMGLLLQGGVSVMHALQIARSVMRNRTLEAVIAEAEKKIIEGSMLSRELGQSQWIPSLVTRMLAVGEESGTLPAMLLKIADLYEAEVEKTVTRITSLAQPVILLGMGCLIGTIMLAVLLPLTDISAFMN